MPLHKPALGLIFLKSIIGKPIFKFNSCGGIPEIFNEFRNSVGYLACCESSKSESFDGITINSPGITLLAILFISSHFSLVAAKIKLLTESVVSFWLKGLSKNTKDSFRIYFIKFYD